MIKKSIDSIKPAKEQKNEIYNRICADYKKKENKSTKFNWIRYCGIAAATVFVAGAVAIVAAVLVNMQGVPVTHPESIDSTGSVVSVPENSNNSHVHSEDGSCGCDSFGQNFYDYSNICVDTKPVFMTWNYVDESTPQVVLFKNIYGIPEYKPFPYEDTPDENVFCVVENVNYADRYYELTKLVSSDQSPDIFPYESFTFPLCIYKGLFSNIDGLFDFKGSEWALHNEYSDAVKWKGKTYAPIISIDSVYYLWYRKSVVEDYGLSDPYTLYKEGKWDWSTFFEMSEQFVESGEKAYAIDGYSFVMDCFVASAGKSFFSVENGTLINNLYDSDIETIMDMLMTKFNSKDNPLRYPMEVENNYNPSKRLWVTGKTLFYADSTIKYEDEWQKYAKLYDWDEDEIQLVPFPKSDGSNGYYYKGKINSYLLCTGSHNQNAYEAWIWSNLLVENDKSAQEYIKKNKIDKYNWTRELLDRIDETTESSFNTPVFDAIDGVASNYNSGLTCGEDYMGALRQYPYLGDKSFAEVRSEYEQSINAVVYELNNNGEKIDVQTKTAAEDITLSLSDIPEHIVEKSRSFRLLRVSEALLHSDKTIYAGYDTDNNQMSNITSDVLPIEDILFELDEYKRCEFEKLEYGSYILTSEDYAPIIPDGYPVIKIGPLTYSLIRIEVYKPSIPCEKINAYSQYDGLATDVTINFTNYKNLDKVKLIRLPDNYKDTSEKIQLDISSENSSQTATKEYLFDLSQNTTYNMKEIETGGYIVTDSNYNPTADTGYTLMEITEGKQYTKQVVLSIAHIKSDRVIKTGDNG